MNCPQVAALTLRCPHQYYSNKMGAVLTSMTEVNRTNRNGPGGKPCLMEEMQGLTSLPVSNWMAMGTSVNHNSPQFLLCKIKELH